jgi:excisionase family DNA binding protein
MTQKPDQPRLTWTVEEAAKRLGIGRGQAYAGVRAGQIPSIKIGKRRRLVPVAALERMLSMASQQVSES